MPRTSTIPPGLKQLLDNLRLTVTSLSKRTGILKARLIQIYQEGKPTLHELQCLFAVLGPALVNYLVTAMGAEIARFLTYGVQMGLFTQAGSYNKQSVVVNNYVNLVINVTHVAEPQTKALGHLPHLWPAQQLQPGGQVHQIGQPAVVKEFGRAA